MRREDIVISGRGTVDAKASVASQIIAALSHLDTYPDTALALLFVVSEERGGGGMRHFSASPLNTSPPTFHTIIFGEPTDLALASGHKGNLRFDISAKGVPAHSGYPWLGLSAISEILPALSKLDMLGDIPGGLPWSDKYGPSTLNIGLMQGGVAGNVVPASASATVSLRLAGGTLDEAKSIILQAVHDATRGNKNVTVQFSAIGSYGPVDLDADVDGFNITVVNYGTDVPNWEIHDNGAPAKVKRYLYGPGSILVAHGEHEGLTVGNLETGVEGYKRLIMAAVERGKELRG
jgi:acetylornithine deacetylase